MNCAYQNICGGCPLRSMNDADYKAHKIKTFQGIVAELQQENIPCASPIFIADGQRRRAELTFSYHKNELNFGFNAAKSHEIINIDQCPALETRLNGILPKVRTFLLKLCQIKNHKKVKNKLISTNINAGDIFLSAAENGVDVLLETDAELSLEQRICVCDFANENPEIIRIALKRRTVSQTETIIEKTRPYINIAEHSVFIPAGTFLQASKAGEQALVATVLRYMGTTAGKIADLFCGVGTFSYPLARNIKNKITAVDASADLLDGFQQTINALTIPNIQIIRRNLFKYPLVEEELNGFSAIIFDPPRAGASTQIKAITSLKQADKPQKIVAVSCNPHTFINDANQLLSGGYGLCEITMVDQFVYANHLELVALFEKL